MKCLLCQKEEQNFESEFCERCGKFLFNTIWHEYQKEALHKGIFEFLSEKPWLLFLR